MLKPRTLTIIAIIMAVAVFRFLPHPPNVSPVAAMALFGGACVADRRLAFLLPFAALSLSDLVIGLHDTMIYVYTAFALTVIIGMFIRERLSTVNVAMATVVSSSLFFTITNFGVWASGGHGYAMDGAGLIQTYVAGIPFLQYSLLGNLFFVTLMFGGYAIVRRYRPQMVNA